MDETHAKNDTHAKNAHLENQPDPSSSVSNSKNASSYLKICLWNAQSLKNKSDIVIDYRAEHDLDVLLFTECWLKQSDHTAIGLLENYLR